MKLGYLSPKGKFYECNYWEHMDLATRICKKITDKVYDKPIELIHGYDAERYLLDLGYICFGSRYVVFNQFCSEEYRNTIHIDKFVVNLLTEVQSKYLNSLDFDNLDQMDAALKILRDDEDIKKYVDIDDDLIVNKGDCNVFNAK